MSTATQQYCNIHHSEHSEDSILNRVWNRISHSIHAERINKDISIQEKILREQKELEIQNLVKRNTDIQRILVRNIF